MSYTDDDLDVVPGEPDQTELNRLKRLVGESSKYFSENYTRFKNFKKLIFQNSLTQDDETTLNELGRPTLTFNILESIINRLCGEFAMLNTEIKLEPVDAAPPDPDLLDALISIIRGIFYDSESENIDNTVIKDCYGGGFSVLEVYTDYTAPKSWRQKLKLGTSYDPVLTGFDPNARAPHKGDGRYAYKYIPMTEHDFKEYYRDVDISSIRFNSPDQTGFNGGYRTQNKQKMIFVCEFYLKVDERVMVHQLADGTSVTSKELKEKRAQMALSPDPADVSTRTKSMRKEWRTFTKIMCYRFIQNKILEVYETSFEDLPLVFVDGNSVMIDGKQVTRPYAYNAIDAQRAKNILGNCILDQMTNARSTTLIAPLASLPLENPKLMAPYEEPQKQYSAYSYHHQDKKGNPIPAPQVIQRDQISQETMSFFDTMDSLTQTILGSYDAQLGIQDDDISGKAILNGATQSNSAAKPFIINYIAAMNQIARILMKMIPKIYITPRTVPVVDKLGNKTYRVINDPKTKGSLDISQFDPNVFGIYVEAGPSFELQKRDALNTLTSLAQSMPALAQLLQQPQGLEILLENLEINGVDKLRELNTQLAQQAQQQAAQQQQQPNPQVMEQQNKAMQLQQNQQKMQQDQIKNQQDYQVQMAQVQSQDQKNQIEAQAAQHQQYQDYLNLLAEQDRAKAEIIKATTADQRSNAELELKKAEMALNHFHFTQEQFNKVQDARMKHGMDYIKHLRSEINGKN